MDEKSFWFRICSTILNSLRNYWLGFTLLCARNRATKPLHRDLREELNILFLKLQTIESNGLHNRLRSVWKSTSDSAVALLLLIKFVEIWKIELFRHFRMQNSLSDLFVLYLYFFDSKRPPAKIRATSLVACCAWYAFSRSLML